MIARRALAALLAGACLLGMFACGAPAEKPQAGAQTIEFRLGERTFTERGTEIPFPLDGILSVPEGENRPVVFILHGAHQIDDVTENRYYNGFTYLAQHLAQQGYAAVSLNVNRAYSFEPIEGDEGLRTREIFKAYYDLLARANAGERVFEADLTGKLDLSSLSFIGHSRGGDNSLRLARIIEQEQPGQVRGVLVVASPLMMGYEQYALDVPTAVILPQYDGDVVSLDSGALFDAAYAADETRKTPVASAFLYGGNHNHFNALLTGGDALAPPKDATYIAAEQQQAFLCAYATAFLAAAHNPGADWVGALGNDAPARLGVDFMPSVFVPGGVRLLTPDKEAVQVQGGMQLQSVLHSLDYTKNTAAPLKLPGGLTEGIALYRMRWAQAGAALQMDCAQRDWSGFSTLSLLLANDTATAADDKTPLAIKVILTDGDGNEAEIALSEEKSSALRRNPTETENVFAGMDGMPAYWDALSFTPLSTQLVPLSAIDGVNLHDIRRVTLQGTSASGHLLLRGMDLYPG